MKENHNISDELLIEELNKRLRGYKDALEKLNELNSQLVEVNKKLTESESLKSHFISNITNELVNPFASILGLSKSIIETSEKNPEKIKKMAFLIYQEAFSLDFQLKNIFAAAEIEAGEALPQISNVNIIELTSGLIENYYNESQQKQINIELIDNISNDNKTPFLFKTDSEKLTIVLSNLLSNAIKYTNKKGKIVIEIKQEDNMLHISVKDNGIGISQKDQKVIYDRFKRLDDGINSLNRGHGLGLSINKAYIDLLDGELLLESTEEKGSIFTVILPESDIESDDLSSEGNEIFFGNDELF